MTDESEFDAHQRQGKLFLLLKSFQTHIQRFRGKATEAEDSQVVPRLRICRVTPPVRLHFYGALVNGARC